MRSQAVHFGFRCVFLTGVAVALTLPSESSAEEAKQPPPRPLHYGGIEVNVLSPLAGRMGGQAQLAVPGPFVLVGGLSRVHHEDTQRWSTYDSMALGMPALRGWSYEGGPRFFPLNFERASIWIGASFVYEELEQSAAMGDQGLRTVLRPKTNIGRVGGALDAGVHVKLAPFYATIGAGFVARSANRDFFERGESAGLDTPWLHPNHVELWSFSPRLLIAIGLGH